MTEKMTEELCLSIGGHCFVDSTDVRTWGQDPDYLKRMRVCKHCGVVETQMWLRTARSRD